MTRILFEKGSPLGPFYSKDGPTPEDKIRAWPAGQVREVSDELAHYLTSTFPECFVEPGAVPAPAEATSVQLDVLLQGTVAQLSAELERGDHDAYLDALAEAEEAGKGRKGIADAIAARLEALTDPGAGA